MCLNLLYNTNYHVLKPFRKAMRALDAVANFCRKPCKLINGNIHFKQVLPRCITCISLPALAILANSIANIALTLANAALNASAAGCSP